jgi:hypothetical protein
VSTFGRPVTLLRIEGLAVLAVAAYLYSIASGDWILFALLLFVPDIGMLGYLRGSTVGAVTYNLFHIEALPLALAAGAIFTQRPVILAIALVWLAHIGMDRALGYGLKLTSGFRDTHLGRIGRRAEPVEPWRREPF